MVFPTQFLLEKQWRRYNKEVYSEYTPVEQKRDKKPENDPMETTSLLFGSEMHPKEKRGAATVHNLKTWATAVRFKEGQSWYA